MLKLLLEQSVQLYFFDDSKTRHLAAIIYVKIHTGHGLGLQFRLGHQKSN